MPGNEPRCLKPGNEPCNTGAEPRNKLVVTCMDLRMVSPIAEAMDRLGHKGRYDLVSVAGGGLSVGMDERAHLSAECQCQLDAWSATIHSHVGLSQKLHDVGEVWFIDHEDCGAYAHFFDRKELSEEEQHLTVLRQIPAKFPHMKVRLFWMKLDGVLVELSESRYRKSST